MRGHRHGPGLSGRGNRWRGSWRGGPSWYPSPVFYDAPASTVIIADSPIPVVQTVAVPVATTTVVPLAPGDTRKFLIGAGIATALFLLFR